ncbi:hypothetical protein BXZ70DRAFT_890040 [Cristinia sonorae]|uniref:Uncharacterized protein n=1 Tax=Cristinia sonorae TaxID=1940300 RepID=A0A8K0UTW7_9AGAR|nr:hypothetical protein BXZ70DRAFT_890040 [Cristinia sonorae]
MASSTPSRATPPASRRSPSVSSTAGSPPPSSINKGATARSAVTPRVSASLNNHARRPSIKGTTSPPPVLNGETRESLSASLKLETEKKEQLMVQLQDKDQSITTLRTENDSLTSALHAAETRLAELYADQNRMEEEMASRIEVTEKLRSQVRELEKEKRDLQRRYNEQVSPTATFEAERQAFYDNEQHLKSRIQSLSQARKQPVVPPSPSRISVADSETENEDDEPYQHMQEEEKQDVSDPDQEPAEMTALKLELSTLSTSYTSLQSTLHLLQSQLVDLKRVNNELQEENESYNILLRERTLNGQFDVLKMGASGLDDGSDASGGDDEDEEAEADNRDTESFKSRATGRSTLDPVDETEELEHEPILDPGFEQLPTDEALSGDLEEEMQARNPRSRHNRKRSSIIAPRGESLANLPITGPGLDLAAELGRAENKDMLDGHVALEHVKPMDTSKTKKKGKKGTADRKVSSPSEPPVESTKDMIALQNEVKSLKDANKALSLYASKIIDRIISQEGFEHVLAVDYEKSPANTPATAHFTTFSNVPKSPAPPSPSPKKPRPQSAMFSLGSTSTAPSTPAIPPVERLTTFDSIAGSQTASPQSNSASPPTASASTRASRRSMSFDWKSFSLFNAGDKKPEPSPNLRPLTLKAGASITGARKLDTLEDEEDRKERERLNATMKLMGIEKPAVTTSLGSPVPPMFKSHSAPEAGVTPETPSTATPVAPTPSSRFSFFRRTSSMTTNSDSSSIHSSPHPHNNGINTPNLTHEALEQAEAEGTLAALDAHERQLSAEIAKGSPGGFTELSRRSGDRRSSRRSGSGSTVWSAGMSRDDD